MFLYVHKYPPARPSEANFALPEPARSPKSQKKPGSSPPEDQKLEARTSLILIFNSEILNMETSRRSSKRQKNKIPNYSTTKLKRSITTIVDQKDKQQYRCDICGKIYFSRYHYHNHLKQYDYTSEEVSLSIRDLECIKCEFCLRKFNELTGLIEHLQTSHINNKFKCCEL